MPQRPLPDDLSPANEGAAERRILVANRLNSAAIHLLRRISRDDGADGVTGARLSALSVLVYGGPQTLGSLARREGVATPTMTRIVDALVRDGLVGRTPVEGDRRQVRLTVTPDGQRLMERGRARRIGRLASDLQTLAPHQLEELERALDVLEHLEQEPSR
jgi:DNA-binding MarR family transcriptional regulator